MSQSGAILRCIGAGPLIVVFALAGAAQEQGVASPTAESATPTRQVTPRPELPADARAVADLLGITPLLDRLDRLSKGERVGESAASSLDILMLRQEVTERVTAAALEVDGVLSQIGYERALLQDARRDLQGKRDRGLGRSTLAGLLIGSVGGVVGAGMQFNERTAKAGDVVGLTTGGVATVLSLIALRQERGGKAGLGSMPNMLARFFDRPSDPSSLYPDDVWRYLATAQLGPPGGPLREQLLQEWTRMGRIDVPGSADARRKIDLLTTSGSEKRDWSIDVLRDREAMLGDAAARVILMKRGLSQILRALAVR